MAGMKELFQSADWKREKHVPVIDSVDAAKKGEAVRVSVSVGKEIPHPNKTEHHIRWIEVYFQPDGSKVPFQLARIDFTAHGESVEGPDTSTIYSNPSVVCSFKTDAPGILLAASFCNIHGLWESSKRLEIS